MGNPKRLELEQMSAMLVGEFFHHQRVRFPLKHPTNISLMYLNLLKA